MMRWMIEGSFTFLGQKRGSLANRSEVGVEIINFVDDCSRAVLCSNVVKVATSTDVVRLFFSTADLYGLPASVLSDNGAIYTASYRESHTGLEIDLATLGILFKHGKPYHPQTQGKVERLQGPNGAGRLRDTRPGERPTRESGDEQQYRCSDSPEQCDYFLSRAGAQSRRSSRS